MDDQSPPPRAPDPSAGSPRHRMLWPLAAVAIVAVVGAGAGAYFGLRGAAGPGSAPGASPPPRAFAAAAYDEASHEVVLFGGIGAEGSALDDTWTWDGSTWTQRHPAASPPARAFAAATYDPKAHDVVLVGGRSVSTSPLTVCSGSVAPGGPNATSGVVRPPAACNSSASTEFADTWVWDGSTWRLAGATPTTALFGEWPAIATDPTTGQVLLLGESRPAGMNPACPSPVPSFPPGTPIPQVAIPCMTPPPPSLVAWVWQGSRWATLTAGSPPFTSGAAGGGLGALVADPTSGHLVDISGGLEYACAGAASPAVAVPCPLAEGSSGAASSSGSTGTAAMSSPLATPPPASPPTRVPMPMPTNIPSPGLVTCCPGSIATWTGSTWSTPKSFSSGPQVSQLEIAGDPAQRELVAVTPPGMWTWNGSAWKAEHPPASPPPGEGGSLVYDGVSGKLLLFGGEPAPMIGAAPIAGSSSPASKPPSLAVSDELWAWDGTTWTQLTGAKASAPSLPPAPTPTSVPPGTPVPGSPVPSRVPSPTPGGVRCTPTPTPTPAPTPTSNPAPGPSSSFGCGLAPPTSG